MVELEATFPSKDDLIARTDVDAAALAIDLLLGDHRSDSYCHFHTAFVLLLVWLIGFCLHTPLLNYNTYHLHRIHSSSITEEVTIAQSQHSLRTKQIFAIQRTMW